MISPEKIAEMLAGLPKADTGYPQIPTADLRAILSELLTLRAERDEARANEWPFGKRPNPVCGHTYGDFAVYGDEKSIKRVSAALHEHDAMMPARVERIQQLTAALSAAEAQLARQGEVLKAADAAIDLGLDLISDAKGWGKYQRMEGVEIYEDAAKFGNAAEAYRDIARSTLSPEDSQP